MINKNVGFTLYGPKNCYDTNYHLIDTVEKVEYLIDIHDVYNIDDLEEMYNNGGITWEELKSLDDIGLLIDMSWATKKL